MFLRSGVLLSSFIVSCLGRPASQPYGNDFGLPFSTDGRDVKRADGEIFTYAGTNWPGHQEINIPEGLQYSSIKGIASKIKAFGLNSVRLTFAIQLVDDIYDNKNSTLAYSTINALGAENGTKVLDQILKWNPQFTPLTTRLEVYDAVAEELAAQGIILHLDNHMSTSKWCCSLTDGNGWFNSQYFDTDKWVRGWKYMAKHAAENWSSFASVGLRNELRQSNGTNIAPYDWYSWYVHMTEAAKGVHEEAPDALIFFSGLDYDVYIDPIPKGLTLNGTSGTATEGKTAKFVPSDFDFEDKIVLEIHKYDFENTQDSCDVFDKKWYAKGFQALNASDPVTQYTFPVVITEWGFIQNGTYWNQTTYNKCLIEFVKKRKVGWIQWDVSGSYYVKNGVQDIDEAWGLLNHNYTGTRSQVTVENSLFKMIDAVKS